jgi:hypothetical protein
MNPINNPLHNPGTSPVQGTPGVGTQGIGAEPGEQKKDFSLPSQGSKEPGSTATIDKPSPMQLSPGSGFKHLSAEEMNTKLQSVNDQLDSIKGKLQDPGVTQKLTPDHLEAMKKVVDKMNPDMRTISNETGQSFKGGSVEGKDSGSLIQNVTQWINGSQSTLSGALNYLSTHEGQNSPSSFMKLQYSVQRASQRAELFSSIISSSVSGIKTIMSTQLG